MFLPLFVIAGCGKILNRTSQNIPGICLHQIGEIVEYEALMKPKPVKKV